ncbi:MAG: hypothetical protein MUQ25_03790 [Candidatus Aminicenantes bacterium]|nr:hypothetical protein [Candidatus Aminicenantes bacterium]
MFKGLGDAIGAFFSDPLRFLVDPSNVTIEYQTKKMVEAGKTADEIQVELEEAGLKKGAGPVKVIIDTVGKTLELLLKYLPLIVFGMALFLVLSLFGRAKAVVK